MGEDELMGCGDPPWIGCLVAPVLVGVTDGDALGTSERGCAGCSFDGVAVGAALGISDERRVGDIPDGADVAANG